MTSLDMSLNTHRSSPRQLGIWQRIFGMGMLRKERRELANLSDDQLKDIGITPDQARKEAMRAAWDVPCGWINRV